MNSYDIGSSTNLVASFINSVGIAVDPTTVILRIKNPKGIVSVNTPTNTGVGLYSYELALDIAGVYYYRFEGTGTAIAAADSSLTVVPSPVFGC